MLSIVCNSFLPPVFLNSHFNFMIRHKYIHRKYSFSAKGPPQSSYFGTTFPCSFQINKTNHIFHRLANQSKRGFSKIYLKKHILENIFHSRVANYQIYCKKHKEFLIKERYKYIVYILIMASFILSYAFIQSAALR